MALINITRKPSTLQGYQLATPADMTAAVGYLAARGYSGTVNCFKQNDVPTWQISLVNDNGQGAQQLGMINDWIVIENDQIATIYPAAKAVALFQ